MCKPRLKNYMRSSGCVKTHLTVQQCYAKLIMYLITTVRTYVRYFIVFIIEQSGDIWPGGGAKRKGQGSK